MDQVRYRANQDANPWGVDIVGNLDSPARNIFGTGPYGMFIEVTNPSSVDVNLCGYAHLLIRPENNTDFVSALSIPVVRGQRAVLIPDVIPDSLRPAFVRFFPVPYFLGYTAVGGVMN